MVGVAEEDASERVKQRQMTPAVVTPKGSS